MTRYMTRRQAGLRPVRGHRPTDHRGKAVAHWSATSQTPRAVRGAAASNEPPRKPGPLWYRLWRNPTTEPVRRRNISRRIRAYNRARRAYNEATRPDPRELARLDILAARIARGFQASHMDARGWLDIGYHRLVFGHGLVIEGRPLGTHGAHAGPSGNYMAGVCFVMGPGDTVTPEMEEAARDLERRDGFVLDEAHFDHMATQCPGRGPGSITDLILGRGPQGGPRR